MGPGAGVFSSRVVLFCRIYFVELEKESLRVQRLEIASATILSRGMMVCFFEVKKDSAAASRISFKLLSEKGVSSLLHYFLSDRVDT